MADTNQINAIESGMGPVMILAGPGSGKTYILTHRIQYLINNLNISPQRILVITFTKKAAVEMKNRFLSLDSANGYDVNFGTFHSVFYKFLKLFSNSELKILSNEDKIRIISELIKSNPLVYNSPVFSNNSYDDLSLLISIYKTNNKLNLEAPDFNKFLLLYNDYEKVRITLNKLDFDDILIETNKLLANNSIKKRLKSLFDYILIDEFQDINELQWKIIKELVNDTNNIFVVGDDDQSIYGFRGSDNAIMSDFKKEYNCKIIELINNYRSCSNIINASEKIIINNKNRLKNQYYKAIKEDSGTFATKECGSMEEQLDFIKTYTKNNPNIKTAILLRTNKDVYKYKKALLNSSFNIKNNKKKDILAYISFCINEDKSSLLKILRNPESYIPADIFVSNTIKLKEMASKNSRNPYGQRIYILDNQINVLKHLSPYTFLNYLINIIKVNDEEYCKSILNYAKKMHSLSELMAYIENDINKEINSTIDNENCDTNKNISIITYHASKGLEFDTVFLPDVVEGKIPNITNIFDLNVEEERRLFYVAMTRAKNELYITYIKKEGSKRMLPSRFITELIEDNQFSSNSKSSKYSSNLSYTASSSSSSSI